MYIRRQTDHIYMRGTDLDGHITREKPETPKSYVRLTSLRPRTETFVSICRRTSSDGRTPRYWSRLFQTKSNGTRVVTWRSRFSPLLCSTYLNWLSSEGDVELKILRHRSPFPHFCPSLFYRIRFFCFYLFERIR